MTSVPGEDHTAHTTKEREASFAGEVLKEAAYLLGKGKKYSGGKSFKRL